MTLTLSGTAGMTAPQGAVYNGLQYATAQTPTTTNADFTNIPSWAKRVTVVFSAVSTNASTAVNIQLGTGGVFATSGYASTAWTGGSGNTGDTSTSSFIVDAGGQTAATSRNGSIVFHNIDGNTWVGFGNITRGGTVAVNAIAGTVTLGGALDSLRVLSGSGNLFDAGTINVFWE